MTRNPWPLIFVYYAAGVYAAAQLGKVAALAPLMAADLGLGLVTMALATSLIEIGGATLGIVAGGVVARIGLRVALLGAVVCLGTGSIGGATAGGGAALIAWRVLEAVGYLGVIVSAPVLIARSAGPQGQGTALALWSSFVPVGLALGAWGHAAIAAQASWRVAMVASAAVGAAVLIALLASRPPALGGAAPHATTVALRAPAAAWCLAASFGGYALFEVGLLALLPQMLTTRGGMSVTSAAAWTGLAALATIIGSAAAAWLLRQRRSLVAPVVISLIAPALVAFAVFPPAGTSTVAAVFAVALNALSGVFASLAFAQAPVAAGGVHRMAQVNGLIAQFGASGSLLGPPLMAAAVERWGWGAAAACGLLVSLLAVPLALKAFRASPTR
jgi:MFS family permease